MFDRIAVKYRFINSIMTFGMDKIWRKRLIRKASIRPGFRVLDVGTGTGDCACSILKMYKRKVVVIDAVDLSEKMLYQAQLRNEADYIRFFKADCLHLPFDDNSFDAVISAFFIRNSTDALAAFTEQCRVAKPGAVIACLDTSPPQGFVKIFHLIHLKIIIPLIAILFSGNGDAYSRLVESTLEFYTPEELSTIMKQAGLLDVNYKRNFFGASVIHWGKTPC